MSIEGAVNVSAVGQCHRINRGIRDAQDRECLDWSQRVLVPIIANVRK